MSVSGDNILQKIVYSFLSFAILIPKVSWALE